MRFRCIGMLACLLTGFAIVSGVYAQQPASTDDEKTRQESESEEERQTTVDRMLWLQTGMERLEEKQQWIEWLQQGVTFLEPKERADLLKLLQKGAAAPAAPAASAVPAASAAPASTDQAIATLNELKQEEETLRQWMQSGKEHLPSFQSPFATTEEATGLLPIECLTHLEGEKAAFAQDDYSKEAWLHHVFECKVCCAPLLKDVIEIHTSHVAEQPHEVILFNFDTYALTKRHQQQLSELLYHFDPKQDQILLVGRASRIGDRSYNIVLSGKRAGAITDYLMETFSLEESQMRYLYFGYDPPQLTLAHINYYGINQEDIDSLDPSVNTSIENKINQSVVVVIYKPSGELKASDMTLQDKDKHGHN